MKHNTFYKNMIWQYGLQILRYLFPYILIPYLSRVLKPETYAVYSYVLQYMTVIQVIADFGFTLSGAKKVVSNKNNETYLGKLLGNITLARCILLLLLSLLTIVVSQYIPILHDNLPYVMISMIPLAFRALLPDFIFQGYEKMGPLTTRYFAAKGVQVILTLLLVHSPTDLMLVVVADIVGSVVGLGWSYHAVKSMFNIRMVAPSVRESISELKESSVYCISNVSSSLLSGFTTLLIGRIITNNTEISYWTQTINTIGAIQALYVPITNSLYPHMLNNQDYRFAKRLALLALPALIVGTVLYCVLSEQIMLVLGGEEYIAGAHVMVAISPILFFSFYAMLIGWPIIGTMGYVNQLTITTIVSGAYNVVALLLLHNVGNDSLDSICFIRWTSDAVLFGLRALLLFVIIRRKRIGDSLD